YFPKQSFGQHPSFMDVMRAVVDAWDTKRESVEGQADHITAAISQPDPVGDRLPTIGDMERAVGAMANAFDRRNGGFGGAPKFPQPPALEFLLRTAVLRPETEVAGQALEMLTTTLTAMADGGIYDHLFGGFARYSVDERWVIPHFEKMLYDNALLARLYLRAWQVTRIDHYRDVAREVLDYLDGPMADPAGGIHSAEDADSEGVEGKFAVWTWDELGEVLGDDRDLAAAIYGTSPEGNFEGANNLHRQTTVDAAEVAEARDRIDDRLRAARSLRVPPGRDDKVVTAWNGLALRAFAEAAAALDEDRYLQRAISIASFLVSEASPDGSLVRSWRKKPGHGAFADDFAATAIGLYTLYSVTGDEQWFTAAEEMVQELRGQFADPDGGFFATSDAASPLIVRPKNTQDNPTPSDNALAMEALLLHAAFTGDTAAIGEAERTMMAIAQIATRHPLFGGHALAVWSTHLAGMKEVAIVGADTQPMENTVWSTFRPDVVVAPSDGSKTTVPLLLDRSPGSPALAYVCRDLVCDLPVGTPDLLADKLSEVR
ncbi:MAG: thioredoxin domain-containing protein, partial [Acidimicrobiia bacterium]